MEVEDRAQFGAQNGGREGLASTGLKLSENDAPSLVEGAQILGLERPAEQASIGQGVAKHHARGVMFLENLTPLRTWCQEGCTSAKQQFGGMTVAAQHLRQRCDGSGPGGCVALVDEFRGYGSELVASVR